MFTSHQRRKKKKKKSCKRSYLVNITALLHLNNLRENTMLRKYYQGIKNAVHVRKMWTIFALLQPPCPYLFTSNSFSMISHIFNLMVCTVFSGYWDEISYCFHHILECLFFSPQLFYIYPWLRYFLSFCFISSSIL